MEWIQTLRSFSTAVQQGSLSAAARVLGSSPASVSRHIASLEERLGTQLLKRSSRNLALTEAGEIYYPQVEQILQQLHEANSSVTQLQTKPQGVLRVHSRMLVGQLMIVPNLPSFLAQYPEITVDLMLSNSIASVLDQGTDVDIRIGSLDNSSLIARKLAASERVVVATQDYLQRSPPIREPRDLSRHNCLSYRINLGATVWRFKDAEGRVEEVPIHGSVRTDFGHALVDLACASVGVALLPDWSVRAELAEGRLVRLLGDYSVSHIDFDNGVYAVFPAARQTSLKLRLFVEFMAGVFRRERAAPRR